MASQGDAARGGNAPGRSCPVSYRYGARALSAGATLFTETLWVAGGLYGNRFALDTLIALYDREPGDKALVFNGDFHWFDASAEDFARVNHLVLAHAATRGNVEAELASPADGAGCGCGYPQWVGDAEVERSNRILERLRATACGLPAELAALAALPPWLVAEVGGERVGVVHGDAESLAGWGFSQEALATAAGEHAAGRALTEAGVRVFASSHSCLPVMQAFGGERVVANNGSAGMPNFERTRYGIATRISVRPSPDALYAMRAGLLFVEAVAVKYEHAAWQRRFLELWPVGSDAHRSYWGRIAHGPRYGVERALRAQPALAA
jgi:hypothetical protein